MSPAPTLSDERGQVGGLEAIAFGVLVFVVGSLLVANAWAVVDAKLAVTAAAREAARAYVEAPTSDRAAVEATQAAAETLAGYGRDSAALALDLPDAWPGYQRCRRVAVTARYRVPAITLPWIGGLGDGFTVRATHTEVIDPFRRGIGGDADCA